MSIQHWPRKREQRNTEQADGRRCGEPSERLKAPGILELGAAGRWDDDSAPALLHHQPGEMRKPVVLDRVGMAGLWETWRSPAGERIRSFTIITTKPNELCAELHDRMPVVLQPDVWPLWLGEQPADVPQLKALLAPHPSEDMICWPVSARVGNVKNNDPSLIEPIAGVV
jgi:hypothetical protein